jgi:hypothetical protein
MSVEQDIPQRGKSSGVYNSISAIGIRPNLSLTEKSAPYSHNSSKQAFVCTRKSAYPAQLTFHLVNL